MSFVLSSADPWVRERNDMAFLGFQVFFWNLEGNKQNRGGGGKVKLNSSQCGRVKKQPASCLKLGYLGRQEGELRVEKEPVKEN